ncbi:MAG TPA: hypothetical protein VKF41_09355 [Bryobacteraceae bacterium]|nr:hypothetical protein [Bryobacteraceae bacterium]
MARKGVFASVVCLLVCQQASAIDKQGLLSKYKDKFVVVAREGLSTCLHSPLRPAGILPLPPDPAGMSVVIHTLGQPETVYAINCQVVPIHVGEVLKVSHTSFVGGYLRIEMKTVLPHNATRGIGAFAHESMEWGVTTATIGSDKGDTAKADALAAQWFNLDTSTVELGNTASGIFVNHVKAGMSFAEVEAALGVPQTRVDLGEKVLYKYKDMTVEFHDGKVTDVR